MTPVSCTVYCLLFAMLHAASAVPTPPSTFALASAPCLWQQPSRWLQHQTHAFLSGSRSLQPVVHESINKTATPPPMDNKASVNSTTAHPSPDVPETPNNSTGVSGGKQPAREPVPLMDAAQNITLSGPESNSTAAESDERPSRRGSSTSFDGFLEEMRAQRERILNGGFIEIIEWLFVFLLVAPGTFPAIGCVLYGCTNLAQRRFGPAVSGINVNSNFYNNHNNLNNNNQHSSNSPSNSNSFENNSNFSGRSSQLSSQHHHHLHNHSSPTISRHNIWNGHPQRNTLDSIVSLTARTRYKAVPNEEREDP